MKHTLSLLLFLLAIPVYAASDVEELRRKATDQKQAENWAGSNASFFELFTKDPEGPIGQYSLKELKDNYQRSGEVQSSVARYHADVAAKKTPKARDWSESDGGIFDALKQPGQFEKFLLQALQTGGLLAGQSAFLSVLLEQMGFIEEANHYLEETKKIARIAQKEEADRIRESAGVRPLHYTFPTSFERYQLYPESEDALHLPKWREIQSQGKYFQSHAVEEELRVPRIEIRGGANLSYESEPGGWFQAYSFLLGTRTNPAAPWVLGGGLRSIYRVPPKDELKPLRHFSHLPSIWASWAMSGRTEIRVRYDASWTPLDGNDPRLRLPRSSHGPSIGWAQSWGPKLRTRVLTSREWKHDPSESDSGTRTSLLMTLYPEFKKASFVESFFELGLTRENADEITEKETEYVFTPGGSFHLRKNLLFHLAPSMILKSKYGVERNNLENSKRIDGSLFWSISGHEFAIYATGRLLWQEKMHWLVGAGFTIGN